MPKTGAQGTNQGMHQRKGNGQGKNGARTKSKRFTSNIIFSTERKRAVLPGIA